MNTETVRNPEEEKTWERTSVAGILRHKSGRYYGRLSVAGKDKFFALKTDLLEIARKKFADERARHERVRKAIKKTGRGIATMGDLLEIHRTQVMAYPDKEMTPARKASILQQHRYITTTWPEFPKLDPTDITPAAIREWRSRAISQGTGYRPRNSKTTETRGKSAFTFNVAFDCVRRLIDIAVERSVIASNILRVVPNRGPEKLKATIKRKRPTLPSRDQLNAIFAAVEAGTERGGWPLETADFLRFLAFTGCRLGEAAAVRWKHVDLDKGVLTIPGTKTELAHRVVPLIPAARGLLERIKERRLKRLGAIDPETPVLAIKEAQKSLDRACAVVGVGRLVHHDLRDCFCTTCIEAGIDIPTIARWMGHADGGSLLMKVYGHLRDDHAKLQAARVDFGGAH
jgi:integrase